MHAFFPLRTPSQCREAIVSAVRRRHQGGMDISPHVSTRNTGPLRRAPQSSHRAGAPAPPPTSLLTAMPALPRGFERAQLRSEKQSNGTVFAPRPPTFRRHPADIGLYYLYKRHVQNAAASERPPTKADIGPFEPNQLRPPNRRPSSSHPSTAAPSSTRAWKESTANSAIPALPAWAYQTAAGPNKTSTKRI